MIFTMLGSLGLIITKIIVPEHLNPKSKRTKMFLIALIPNETKMLTIQFDVEILLYAHFTFD